MDKGALSQKNIERLIFIIFILLYLTISVSMAFKQPFGNPPDETYRYKISYYVYEHHLLPNGYDEEIRIPGYGFSYGFQPILPYILQGAVMIITDYFCDFGDNLFMVARLTNCLLGLIMAIFVWKLSKLWFDNRAAAHLFAFMVTFIPQAIFPHTYINTESCAMLSTAIILYAITKGLKEDFPLSSCGLLAVGVILCALSYYNAYGFILSAILLFVAGHVKTSEYGRTFFDVKPFITKGVAVAMLVILGIAWWFARSAMLYDGDFLGLSTRALCGQMYGDANLLQECMVPSFKSQGLSVADLIFRSDFAMISMNTFICAYGSTTILTSMWVYRFYKLLFLAGIIACFIPKRMVTQYLEAKSDERSCLKAFFTANMIMCIVIPIVLSIMYSYNTEYQPQGRYVIPMLIPFCMFVVKGLQKGVALLSKFVFSSYEESERESLSCRLRGVIFGILTAVIAFFMVITVYVYAFAQWESILK